MQNSGDTAPYLALTRGCKSCNDVAAIVDRYYAKGGFIRFEGTEIIRIKNTGTSRDIRQFDVARRFGQTEFATGAGKRTQRYPGGSDRIRITIKREGASWVVNRYAVLV